MHGWLNYTWSVQATIECKNNLSFLQGKVAYSNLFFYELGG